MRRDSDEVAVWAWRGFLYGLAIALGLFIYMMSAKAQAQAVFPADITFSWTNPSQYEDGSAIMDGDLTDTRIVCERNDASTPAIELWFVPLGPGQPQTATAFGAIPGPGTYTCVGYAYADTLMSDPSNQTVKKYIGKPMPIVNLTVVVE